MGRSVQTTVGVALAVGVYEGVGDGLAVGVIVAMKVGGRRLGDDVLDRNASGAVGEISGSTRGRQLAIAITKVASPVQAVNAIVGCLTFGFIVSFP